MYERDSFELMVTLIAGLSDGLRDLADSHAETSAERDLYREGADVLNEILDRWIGDDE